MKRRQFIGSGIGLTAAITTLAAPAVAQSDKSFRWVMTNAYPPGSPYLTVGPGSPTSFVEKVNKMSDGRMQIDHFAAGELIPAMEGFDAVASGTVQMNAGSSYFWAGKVPAAQIFNSVPFGMDYLGTASWLYQGDGLKLWNEIYGPIGVVALPFNDSGIQMTGWFRKPINSLSDLKGLKMRIPGLAGAVYSKLGVNVQLLPASEIFPALERGVIDAAEFVGPYLDRRMGLQNAAKYYYTTGWAEPSATGELAINKSAWDSLPADLQEIIRIAAMASHLESVSYNNAINGEALRDLVNNDGVIAQALPADVVEGLREVTANVLEEKANQYPDFKTVLESYMSFRDTYWGWANVSQKPYFTSILKTSSD